MVNILKRIKNYYKRKIFLDKFGAVGDGSLIPYESRKNISGKEHIFVGSYCSIGPGCNMNANENGRIIIKDGTIIAPNVTMMTRTHNFKINLTKIPYDELYLTGNIEISEGVWIGQNAIILPGVRIGKGAVIGAGGCISKSVPDYAICVGNPAQIVGYRDKEKFDELLATQQFTNKHRVPKRYQEIGGKDVMENVACSK